MFEQALEQARVKYEFCVYGYVVMPEHVHLLVSEPERATLATALKAIKQSVARRRVKTGEHFWQGRYYDFNVGTPQKRIEKLKYSGSTLFLLRQRNPDVSNGSGKLGTHRVEMPARSQAWTTGPFKSSTSEARKAEY